jgi:hypothetical protein
LAYVGPTPVWQMKGVLAVAHASCRYVFHAVHMTFDGEFGEPWGERGDEGIACCVGALYAPRCSLSSLL